jgi:hypothetical protein
MLMTIEEARVELEGAADKMTDEEVERLIQDLEALARLCLDMYKESKRKQIVLGEPDAIVE